MTTSSLIILGAVFFALWFEITGRRLGIAAIPMTPWQRKTVISAVQKYLPTPRAKIAELGCGWGGLIAGLHRAVPQADMTGYELFIPAWLVSQLRFCASKAVHIRRQDIFTADLTQYDVIVCYLSHGLMKRLQEKNFKPGAVIISNAFPFPDWTPVETITTKRGIEFKVFVYRV